MKIIRNEVCYVEFDDLRFLSPLPQDVFYELKVYYSNNIKFIKFTKKNALNFFKENEYIIDYDSIKDLSYIELECKIKEIKNKLNLLSGKWLNGSIAERDKLNKDKEYNSLIKNLKYMLKTLENYKNNKSTYDNEVKEIFDSKRKRL